MSFKISNSILIIKFVALYEDNNDKFIFSLNNFIRKRNIIINITFVNILLVLNFIPGKIEKDLNIEYKR
jgi:hypothetical protein